MFTYKRDYMSHADATVCLSPFDQYMLRSHGVENAVFIPNLRSLTQPVRRDLSEGTNTLLCVARLTPIKNVAQLIRIVSLVKKEVPDVLLKVYGNRAAEHSAYRQEVEAAIKGLGLEQNVELCDFTNGLQREYLKSRMLVSTSLCEGDPMSIQEALDCRKPVVMLGLDYLFRKNCGGVFRCYGEAEMGDRIVRLLKDKSFYKQTVSGTLLNVPSDLTTGLNPWVGYVTATATSVNMSGGPQRTVFTGTMATANDLWFFSGVGEGDGDPWIVSRPKTITWKKVTLT